MTADLEAEVYRKLEAIPEVTAFLPVVRRLAEGDELWIFAVFQGRQLDQALEARITTVVESVVGTSALRCRVCQLSNLPVTNSGRVMRRQVEKFVNHLAISNRLQMRNPEVLEEIALMVKAHESDGSCTLSL